MKTVVVSEDTIALLRQLHPSADLSSVIVNHQLVEFIMLDKDLFVQTFNIASRLLLKCLSGMVY